MKRIFLLGTAAALLSWILWQAPLWRSTWESIDLFCLDSWIRLAANPHPGKVLLVAIDDPSLREIGPWPWPRSLQARLIEKIKEAGAKAIGIDLLYDKAKPGDRDLAQSLRGIPVVLAAYTDEISGWYLENHGLFVEHLFLPLKSLRREAFEVGHIVLDYDPDGIARRVPAFLASPTQSLPAFGLALALASYGIRPREVLFLKDQLQIGPFEIPLDSRGNFFIGYQGGPRSLPWISAAQVLLDRVPKEVFKDKVVLLGVTATKFAKKWASPFVKEGPMSGVEIQAQIVESILEKRIPTLLSAKVMAPLVWGTALLAAYVAGLVPVILVCWLLVPAFLLTWGAGALLYLKACKILAVAPLANAITLSFLNVFALKAWEYRKGLAERTAQLGALASVFQSASLKNMCLLLRDLLKAKEVHGLFLDRGNAVRWVSVPDKGSLTSELQETIFALKDLFMVKVYLQQWLKESDQPHLLVPIRNKATLGWYLILSDHPLGIEEREKAEQFAGHTALLLERESLWQRLRETEEGVVQMWLKNISKQAPALYEHSLLVARLARQLAQALDLQAEQIKNIYEAGLLHDIGLLGAPEVVLREEASEPEARMWLENHPVLGAEILREIPGFQETARIIRYHHERFDGRGFPEGLKGNEIPLEARILALAEGVGTMLAKKIQATKSWEDLKKEIYQEIRGDAGRRFDPRIVQVFLNMKWELENEKT